MSVWMFDVDTLEKAEKIIKYGYVTAFIICGINAILGLIFINYGQEYASLEDLGWGTLIGSAIYAIIGWRILKRSRIWSLIAVGMVIINYISISLETHHSPVGFFSILFIGSIHNKCC
jgi:hypothetical protein